MSFFLLQKGQKLLWQLKNETQDSNLFLNVAVFKFSATHLVTLDVF